MLGACVRGRAYVRRRFVAFSFVSNSDGPPWQPETEVLGHTDGTFGLNSLMQAVMRTKSHKAEDWYERFAKVEINDDVYERFESEAIFIDIHFDYGS